MRRQTPIVSLCVVLLLGVAATGCERDNQTRTPADETETNDDLGDGQLGSGGPGGIGDVMSGIAKADPKIVEAEALLADGKPDRALATIDEAIAQNPSHARFHYVRGNALTYLDRDAEARAAYQTAIDLDDTDALPHAAIGNMIAFSDTATVADQQLAVEHFQTALKLDPRLAAAHQSLGVVLISLGQTQAAIEALETADRLASTVETTYLLATAHGKLGNHARALDYAKAAVALEPTENGVDLRLLLARILVENELLQEAASEFEQAAKLAPESAPLRLEVVRGLLELGDPDAAMVHMQWLLTAAPDQPPVLVNYGRILVAQAKPKDALVQFDEALAIQPDSQAAQTYKIEALVAAKKCKDARAQFNALAKQLGWASSSGDPMPRALVKADGFLTAGKCK